ncbi:DNA-directed RNA polymerase subunit D [Candidatus Woesearchaeota archaeon]|nr:DNA-directed RNA polymerase subunit D [Candidatus Woesearchaeota archaeon]MBW3005694.1 DNA-directed RNA polymerase subunit D [Candidatus Woesearchaeota archaeon]
MAEIQMLKKDKKTGRVSFLLKNTNAAFVNSLRRTIIDTVPTMAIEEVEFRKNSSVLYDEILAHRLGLVPMKTDLKAYTLPAKCKCEGEGCARCTLKMTLKAKGPGIVYASDIKTKDPKIKPAYPKMPIAKLLKGQEIELEATAVLGEGKDHVKFSPGLVWFNKEPKITISNKQELLEKFKEKYPAEVFDKNGKINADLIMDNNLVDACDGVCDDLVKIEYSDKNFIFFIEPWGQLTPAEMVSNAAVLFNETLEEFETKLK